MIESLKIRYLASGLLGMLCPVPLIGEGFLSVFYYQSLKETPFGDSEPFNLGISLSTATLTRIMFYESYYFPMLNSIKDYFS